MWDDMSLWFWFAYLWQWWWACFPLFVGHLYIFFENVYLSHFPIFKIRLFVFLLLSCCSSLYILDFNPLSDNMVYKKFLSCGLPFHFAECFLCSVEVFRFDIVLFIYFCFCGLLYSFFKYPFFLCENIF